MSWSKENLFFLRLPKVLQTQATIHDALQDHADRVREAMRSEALRDRLKIEFFGKI